MPVRCASPVAALLVSSASKMALFGSTMTVFTIGRRTAARPGRTSDAWSMRPDRAAGAGENVAGRSSAQVNRRPSTLTTQVDRRSCPAGSGSRTMTPWPRGCRCCRRRRCRSGRPGRPAGRERGDGAPGRRSGRPRARAHRIGRVGLGDRQVDRRPHRGQLGGGVVTPTFLMLPVTVAVLIMRRSGGARRPARDRVEHRAARDQRSGRCS